MTTPCSNVWVISRYHDNDAREGIPLRTREDGKIVVMLVGGGFVVVVDRVYMSRAEALTGGSHENHRRA